MKRLLIPILALLILSGCSLRIREENADISEIRADISEITTLISTTVAMSSEVESTANTEMQTTEPITTEVIITTTKKAIETTVTQKSKLKYIGTFRVTAYCPCSQCNGQWANGITSTGTTARANHTISVDPDIIPYGTTVVIDGNEYVAEDCGGGINGYEIDVYFDTHQEANNFGVRYAEVYVYEY